MYSNPFQVTSKDWWAGNVPRVILWSYHHPVTKTNQRLQKRILQANIFEYMGSPDNSAGKESTCNAGDPSWFLGWEDPLEKGQAPHSSILGLPWWLNWWRIRLQCGRPGFDPWVGKIPRSRAWQPTPVFLPGESHGQRSLVGCSP